jgi:hypothetical protein
VLGYVSRFGSARFSWCNINLKDSHNKRLRPILQRKQNIQTSLLLICLVVPCAPPSPSRLFPNLHRRVVCVSSSYHLSIQHPSHLLRDNPYALWSVSISRLSTTSTCQVLPCIISHVLLSIYLMKPANPMPFGPCPSLISSLVSMPISHFYPLSWTSLIYHPHSPHHKKKPAVPSHALPARPLTLISFLNIHLGSIS